MKDGMRVGPLHADKHVCLPLFSLEPNARGKGWVARRPVTRTKENGAEVRAVPYRIALTKNRHCEPGHVEPGVRRPNFSAPFSIRLEFRRIELVQLLALYIESSEPPSESIGGSSAGVGAGAGSATGAGAFLTEGLRFFGAAFLATGLAAGGAFLAAAGFLAFLALPAALRLATFFAFFATLRTTNFFFLAADFLPLPAFRDFFLVAIPSPL